mmetsp:Transcript_15204/g.20073  ORF Transcript_15204/g.20073 Transcript_15204/m.20073 type:complete len:128 (-) Transcript_15204:281-664(-)|eukprot:CAMPEP_0117762488 /NCGR_PEP_ID=MMETSP0947-20121206/17966_1 /TAXON_ID=44440 /ORGANISM="Chattonella subsalsa, Strain CCMP2191" /LENGTH=127 /DNA_ID=CAMNT_0005583801 /DNA_START=8 /DNA_END=391 /DNA_ORIENTATION=-
MANVVDVDDTEYDAEAQYVGNFSDSEVSESELSEIETEISDVSRHVQPNPIEDYFQIKVSSPPFELDVEGTDLLTLLKELAAQFPDPSSHVHVQRRGSVQKKRRTSIKKFKHKLEGLSIHKKKPGQR